MRMVARGTLLLVVLLGCVTVSLLVSCKRGGEKEKGERKAQSHPHGVVAVVNGESISLRDLKREMGTEEPSVGNSTAQFVLQNMIDQRLLLQEARKRGIRVPQELISKLAFGSHDATSPKERRWEKRLEDLWLIGKVAEAICPVPVPTEEQVEAYYRTHKDRFFVKDGVVLRQIVLSSKKEAERLRKTLRWKGLKAFEKAAKEYSIGPERALGGRLGLIRRGDEPPGFEVVFGLKPGRVSEVVKTDYGYHLFFVEKRVKDWYLPLEEVRGEIKRTLIAEEGNECLREWLRSARKRAKIEVYREELMSLVGEGE